MIALIFPLIVASGLGCRALEPSAERAAAPTLVVPPVRPEQPAPPGSAPAGAERPDILLISVDGLRADHLPVYGYPRDTAPALSRLAERAVVFDRAYTTAPRETPALASLVSGMYPNQHGLDRAGPSAEETGPRAALGDGVETLAERLSAAGYQALALSDSPFLVAGSGLEQGFDQLLSVGSAGGLADAALPWSEDGRPRFLWAHLSGPEQPFPGRAPWFEAWSREPTPQTAIDREAPDADRAARQAGTERTIAAYDAELRWIDGQIAALIEGFGLAEGDVVVVMGAEGEELYDHGRQGRRRSLYEEQVRVPLLIRAPGAGAGARVTAPVSSIDLLPTLLSLATGARPEAASAGLSGIDLGPALRGETLPARLVLLELRVTDVRYLRGAVWEQWKLISAEGGGMETRPRLYDLGSDPGELRPLGAEGAARIEAMRETITGWRGEAVSVRPESPRRSDPGNE